MRTQTTVSGVERTDYTTKETAQFIREMLKRTYPATKFSVRTSYASMTSSTHVTWTDGPTEAEVDAQTARFTSKSFDGMTDSTVYHDQIVNGQRVSYSGWVTTRRIVSAALLEKALARFQVMRAEYGFPPADLHVVEHGDYSYCDGPDRHTLANMAGREHAYSCAESVAAIARTMRPNGVRIIPKYR